MIKTPQQKREMRHRRIRMKVSGTAERPRLVIFRSLRYNYAQLVDDAARKVIASASEKTTKATGTKTERAKQVGMDLGKKAMGMGIKACVFDRNGYKYHGRTKALAEGAREAGLSF